MHKFQANLGGNWMNSRHLLWLNDLSIAQILILHSILLVVVNFFLGLEHWQLELCFITINLICVVVLIERTHALNCKFEI
jgi:hypothetical protein